MGELVITKIDALINATTKSKRLSTFQQCLKETFGDLVEVLRIKWLDVDNANKAIAIRYPVKNHLKRTLQVSNKLLAMIDALPRKDDRVFATTYGAMLRSFVIYRKRAIENQKNPRLTSD